MKPTRIDEFQKVLWELIDITRGLLPPSKAILCIERMFGLKGISDLDLNNMQNIILPEHAKWSVIKSTPPHQIGEALNMAFHELEKENYELREVFSGFDFNSETMGDKFRRDDMLMSIVQVLSSISFKDEDLELNIAQLIESELKSKVHAFTPTEILKLMIHLLSPEPGMTIYDPFCNDCMSLIESARFLKENYGYVDVSDLNGQAQNLDTYRTCNVNLIINGFLGVHIEKGNTIRSPKFISNRGEREGNIAIFDRVIGTIPIGAKDWGYEIAETDQYNRFIYGIPPRTRGEYGMLQHMIASTNKSGKLAAVVPKGATFRKGKTESRIRKLMLKRDDIIEAVIDLPPKMFPQTTIPCSILVINKNKDKDRKNHVLFIDASDGFEKGRLVNILRDGDIEKIKNVFEKYNDVEGYCSVVPMEKIAANDFSLDVSRYVSKPSSLEETESVDIDTALQELRMLRTQKDAVIDKIYKYLNDLNV